MNAATGTVLVAVSDDFESALAAVMYHARSLVTATNIPTVEAPAEPEAQGDVQPEWYEKWYDGLGYCECGTPLMPELPPNWFTRHLELPGSKLDRGKGSQRSGHTGRE